MMRVTESIASPSQCDSNESFVRGEPFPASVLPRRTSGYVSGFLSVDPGHDH
jgi:hypothetical protein